MIEEWKSLPYCTFYEVSNLGNVRTTERIVQSTAFIRKVHKAKSVALTDNGNGYKLFGTRFQGKKKNFYIHRVVAQLFIVNSSNLPEVNHKDGNKANNRVDNLEWVNRQQNRTHAVINDLVCYGEDVHGNKLTEGQVIEILTAHKNNPSVNRTQLGKKYGVGDSKISGIIKGYSWRRVWEKFHGKPYDPSKSIPPKRINGKFVAVY
jgi:hypothetical protein